MENKLKLIREQIETESQETSTNFDKTKKLCRELIDLSKESIEGHVNQQTEAMRENVEQSKNRLESTMSDVLSKNKAQIIKIKDV